MSYRYEGVNQVNSFLTCTYPLFLFPLLLIQSMSLAEFTDEESEFYMQKGIIPFIAQQQDGDYSHGIYLVPHDLTVEAGKVMTILPGSTILFKKDTKIIVKGKLILQGTHDKRIVLRKLDNDLYLNPFTPDIETPWDGIYLQEGGELEVSYTHICDSKYGFSVTRNATIFVLDSVLFSNNKYQNITVGSEAVLVDNNKLIFYNLKKAEPEPEKKIVIDTIKLSTYVPAQQSVQVINKKQQLSKREIKVRVSMGVIAISGAIIAGAGYYVNDTYYKKYDKMRRPGVDDPDEVGKYELYAKTGLAGLITGSALAVIGASGLTLTFLF